MAQGLRIRDGGRAEKCGALESKQPFTGASHHLGPPSYPLDVVLWECGSNRARYCDFQTNTNMWDLHEIRTYLIAGNCFKC